LILLLVHLACSDGGDAQEPDGSAGSNSSTAAELVITDQELTRLTELLPTFLSSAGIPGMSIAVYRRGEPIWARAFGEKSAETHEAVTSTTVFEAASLSKPVFAYAVMRMVERGEIGLDTPLAEIYQYDRLEHEPRYLQITPRMVMSHSTGLPNWGGDRLDLAFEPGSEFSYSGEGFVFLQRVVEKISGEDLDDFMRREVFGPLGMEHSSYVWQDEYEELSATGHDTLGRPQRKGKPRSANAAASLHTTAIDYARFLGAILEGTGIDLETWDSIFAPQVDAPGDDGEFQGIISWGLGWGLQAGSSEASLWHWGDNGPFKAYVVGYRHAGVGMVYFANSDEGLTVGEAVLGSVLSDSFRSFDWLDYGRYDDPERVARNELLHTYLEQGLDPAIAALEELMGEAPEIATEQFVNGLGYFLLGERLYEGAIAIFELNRTAHPESANVHDSLGEAYLQNDQFEEAILSYQRAEDLDPGNEMAGPSIAWARQSLEARRSPVQIPAATMAMYAGEYGPRTFVLEDGALFYQREGNPRYRLYPLSLDTFGLIGLGHFRVRFDVAESGRVERVVGFYPGGREDASARSS
jgi:CubicO group peptidase (beta-lactamase class C family)